MRRRPMMRRFLVATGTGALMLAHVAAAGVVATFPWPHRK